MGPKYLRESDYAKIRNLKDSLLLPLMVGFLLGTVVLVLGWQLLVARSTLDDIVTKPHVPVISPLMVWCFERIYPSDG